MKVTEYLYIIEGTPSIYPGETKTKLGVVKNAAGQVILSAQKKLFKPRYVTKEEFEAYECKCTQTVEELHQRFSEKRGIDAKEQL